GGGQHAGNTLSSTAAREQPNLNLREADSGFGIVGSETMMACKRELKPAAQGGAVDGRDPGLAAGLKTPEQERELAALGKKGCRCRLGAFGFGEFGKPPR